tara:strand:+ start:103 stop:939 length:837 start_codon:yes stop_codon:yes gene_type:complete
MAVATVRKDPTAKEVWDTLSGINVNEHTEEKGGLTYLSWAWAWSIMMDHYPQLTVKWHGMTDENGVTRDITTYPGGTASVCCSVTIGDNVKREMWLPVMDYKNKAIANPDSRAISDAKQRCLTKCLGILGLGAYVYAGEDLPRDAPVARSVSSRRATIKVAPEKTPKPRATKKTPKYKAPEESPKKAVEEAKEDPPSPTHELTYEDVSVDESIRNLKKTVTDLHERGWTPANDAAKKQITDAIKSRDGEALVRLRREVLTLAESAFKLHDVEEEKHNG